MMKEEKIRNIFEINNYFTLKLEEDGKTVIYVNNQEFIQCKHLLLNIPVDEISSFEEFQSIDQFAEKLGLFEPLEASLPPEVEFWAHCSNLQVWAEQSYNTQLLHSNLAFPLLKKLTEAGDPKAVNVFKFEVLKRFIEGSKTTREFLIEDNYFDHLGERELRSPLPDKEVSTLEKLEKDLQVSFTLAKDPEYITGLDGIERANLYYYNKLKNTNIIGLRIFKEDLKKIPGIIANFKELKYLVLSHNYSEHLPESIKCLRKLEFLDLSVNNYKNIPESYQNLSSLRELDLWSNKFKEIPRALKNIQSLKILNLGRNPIDNFPDKIGKLKKKKDNYYFKE